MSTSSHTTPRCAHIGETGQSGSRKQDGPQGMQGGAMRWDAPATHLGIVDIVDFIKDDPLEIPDDVGAAVQHGAGERQRPADPSQL